MKVIQLWLTLWDPMDYKVHGILQARILERVAIPFSGDLPNPRIEPRSLTLQADSLPAEPPGKSKNTGMGSLSLLRENLPNPGIEARSPALQAESLPAEPQGKPMNTGVGSLSLPQRIFLAQEQNQGPCIACRFFTN